MRQYTLTIHEDLTPDELFTGEPARLHSLKSQRPSVLYRLLPLTNVGLFCRIVYVSVFM